MVISPDHFKAMKRKEKEKQAKRKNFKNAREC